jgi:hypothetical protein
VYSASRHRLVSSANPTTSGTAPITPSCITSQTPGQVQPGRARSLTTRNTSVSRTPIRCWWIADMVASRINAPSSSRSTSPGCRT